MDPITHAVVGLGTAVFSGQDFSIMNPVYLASIAGAVSPDLDILFRLKGELNYLKHHRGASHSIPGMIFFSAVITFFLTLYTGTPNVLEVFLWAFIGTFTHVFLDMLNSYGVKLLWPFSKKFYSLNLLLIYDPLLISLFLFMFLTRNKGTVFVYLSVVCALIYLGIRYYIKKRIQRYLTIKYRRKKPKKIVVMPSLISLFDWDFLIETKKQIYIGKIKTNSKKLYLKRRLKKVSKNPIIKAALKTKLANLFKDFTPYFHIQHFKKDGKHFVKFLDLRYCKNKEFMHSATAVFDNSSKLIEAVFHPFSKKRHIKLSI